MIEQTQIKNKRGRTKRGGFQNMSPEKRREIARKGGAAVPAHKRKFSTDREFASRVGTIGGASVKTGNRSFSKNKELAKEAGRIGGLKSSENKKKRKEASLCAQL